MRSRNGSDANEADLEIMAELIAKHMGHSLGEEEAIAVRDIDLVILDVIL